jgi:hypothetical protein
MADGRQSTSVATLGISTRQRCTAQKDAKKRTRRQEGRGGETEEQKKKGRMKEGSKERAHQHVYAAYFPQYECL